MGKAAEITHNSNNAFGPGTANKYTVLTSANKCSILITGEKLLKIPTYGGWTTRCWITNKSQKNQKRDQNMHRDERKWKHNNPKPVGHCKSSAKEKVCSNTGISQETRNKSNK